MSEEITQERIDECANHIAELVRVMNSLDSEVLEAILRDVSLDQAIGPLLDPTRWRDENLFENSNKTEKAVRAILSFKKEVSGIGLFATVEKE